MTTQSALILFDIDGTLVMAGDRHHARSLLDAFREIYGLKPELDGVPLAGMLDAQITRELYARHPIDPVEAEARVLDVMRRMGEIYELALGNRSLVDRLLPGAAAAVEAVGGRGWRAGALTGNARRVAELKLAAAGLGELAAVGAFGDSARDRGHLVEAALASAEAVFGVRYDARQTVLVGDTPRDIAAARHARASVVAVATGRYDAGTLAALDPDAMLDDLRDTAAFIDALESVLLANSR